MKVSIDHIRAQTLAAEAALEHSKTSSATFALLQRIIDDYSYTNIKKAKIYLDQQFKIVENQPTTAYSVAFFNNKALISNQLYNYEQAEADYTNVLHLLEGSNDTQTLIEVLIDISAACLNQRKLQAVQDYLAQAEELLEQHKNPILNAYFQTRLAYFFDGYQQYQKAFECLLDAERTLKKQETTSIKDIYFMTLVQSGFGRLYQAQNKLDAAIEAYTQTIDICESAEIRTRLSHHYLNLGNVYIKQNEVDKAAFFYQNSVNILDDISQISRASAYSNLGKCSLDKGEYAEANAYLTHAKELYLENSPDDFDNLSVIENYFAALHARSGKPNKAIKVLLRALKYAQKANNLDSVRNICSNLADNYARMKNYEKAFFYQQKHAEISEQYLASEREAFEEIRLRYELDEKTREADLERMRAIQLQHQALRAQMNPHFMFNLLNAIQGFVHGGQNEQAGNYLSKFAQLMRKSLDYSDREIITLEEEIEFLENYLRLNRNLRFEEQLSYKILIDEDVEQDFIGVPSMIIQPYVENAIEHGLKPTDSGILTIEFSMLDDDNILCIIQDNGVGRKQAALTKKTTSKHRSMGTAITEARLRFLHESAGQTEMEFIKIIDLEDPITHAALGTRVEVVIPVSEIKKYATK